MAKIQSLKSTKTRIQEAINSLKVARKEDVRARKKAKASKKPKYTNSIEQIDRAIATLLVAKDDLTYIPKRVA